MVKKKCPYCNRESFSAMVSGQWNCPYCKADITHVATSALVLSSISLRASSSHRDANKKIMAGKIQP